MAGGKRPWLGEGGSCARAGVWEGEGRGESMAAQVEKAEQARRELEGRSAAV